MKTEISKLLGLNQGSKKESELLINQLMNSLFFEATTHEAICRFEDLKKAFESELSKRNLNAMIENSDIDSYFKNTKELKVNNFEVL